MLKTIGILIIGMVLTGFFAGCYQAKEPLVVVDMGQGSSSGRVHDPAPGQPDSELSKAELMQRELAQCQDRLEAKERKLDKKKDELDDVKDECKDKCKRYEKKIDQLEDRIKDLEKQIKKLKDD